MLHHDRGELPVCRSDTVGKSSRGIKAICNCLLGRKRTEMGHDGGYDDSEHTSGGEGDRVKIMYLA